MFAAGAVVLSFFALAMINLAFEYYDKDNYDDDGFDKYDPKDNK